MNTVSCIVLNILDFNNDQPTEILLYGKKGVDNINNKSILDVTINYLIETKGFNAQLFWCCPDVMVLTLILHLNSNFYSFFCFIFIIFYLFIIFKVFSFHILHVYFFIPRCIATYKYIPADFKFFCLMCRC